MVIVRLPRVRPRCRSLARNSPCGHGPRRPSRGERRPPPLPRPRQAHSLAPAMAAPAGSRSGGRYGQDDRVRLPRRQQGGGIPGGSPGIARGRRRDPGMVGPQRSDQGDRRALRRRRIHRARPRSLPRPGDAGARRGQPHDGGAGLGGRNRGRDPGRLHPAQGKLRQGGRHGVLPGRRAHRHRLREDPGMRRRRLLLRHPAEGAGRPGRHRGAVPGSLRQHRLVVHAGAGDRAGEHHEGGCVSRWKSTATTPSTPSSTSRTTPTTRSPPRSPGSGRWPSSARISDAARDRVSPGVRWPRPPSARRRRWRSRRRRSRRPPPPCGPRSRPRS